MHIFLSAPRSLCIFAKKKLLKKLCGLVKKSQKSQEINLANEELNAA